LHELCIDCHRIERITALWVPASRIRGMATTSSRRRA
jgi:hypothetical protein